MATKPRTQQLGAGAAAQMVSVLSNALITGTTTIPQDDTVPQITEGIEVMTLAITPKSASNILVIETIIHCSHSVATWIVGALFKNADANALAANAIYQATATGGVIIRLTHTMVAGGVSEITFRARAGGTGAGTLSFNGSGGVRQWGAITHSSMVITEYNA